MTVPRRPETAEDRREPIRVLVVDANEVLAERLVRWLNDDTGIDVIDTATTAATGIRLARVEEPDVVVMDSELPDMEGAEAARILKARDPDIKVILLTGSEGPGAYYAADQAGVSASMRRASAMHALRDAVHRVFDGEAFARADVNELPALEELVVRYQPVIGLDDGRIVGFEALVRWADPRRGVICPARFLPVAEQTGFINAIDDHVAGLAARQLAVWQRQFAESAPRWVSVNRSATGLCRPDLERAVAGLLEDADVAPESLVIEISETVLLDDSDDSIARLGRIKDTGVRLALDDFGTAFSSVSYLHRFPFDIVKIGNEITSELPESERTLLLVESIRRLVTAGGLEGIAGGIERDEQAEVLRLLGWELGQGYLYAHPIDSLECESLLLAQSESDGAH